MTRKIKRRGPYRLCLILLILVFLLPGCRESDGKIDIAYFFKTEPEKAVLDFLWSMNHKDIDYIYSNLLLSSDKNSISREKYINEFNEVLSDLEKIEIVQTVYLGYENDMSKVVAEFVVTYINGESKQYKKYFYLIEENDKWKIIFEKTFI